MINRNFKLLFIVSSFRKCGPTNQLYGLVKNLVVQGYEISILTLSPEPENSDKKFFSNLALKIYSLDLKQIKGYLSVGLYLKSFLRKFEPDLIHTQGIRPDLLARLFCNNIPLISTSRNFPFLDYPSKYGYFLGNLMAITHLAFLKFFNGSVVACSTTIKEQLDSVGVRATAIQNGVELSRFSHFKISREKKIEMRKRFDIPPTKIIFICVGSLIPRKDVETIVLAFKDFSENDDFFLLLLGDGPQKPQLVDLCHSKSFIRFMGEVPNVAEFLMMADVFISASLAEGLPNSVLEAMASGLPCYLSEIDSHLEIAKDESFAKFFKVKDYEKLKSLVVSTPDNDLLKMGDGARDLVEKKFSAYVMAKNYDLVYREKLSAEGSSFDKV